MSLSHGVVGWSAMYNCGIPGHTHFYFVMSSCHMAVGALCLFLMVQWAGLCFVIVAFPDPEPPCEEGLKICP